MLNIKVTKLIKFYCFTFNEMKKRKLLKKIISGSKNVRFSDAVSIAEAFGFQLDRINGSHHIYLHPDVPEILNLQNANNKAKPYQITRRQRGSGCAKNGL